MPDQLHHQFVHKKDLVQFLIKLVFYFQTFHFHFADALKFFAMNLFPAILLNPVYSASLHSQQSNLHKDARH